jgi:hypothetical protein
MIEGGAGAPGFWRRPYPSSTANIDTGEGGLFGGAGAATTGVAADTVGALSPLFRLVTFDAVAAVSVVGEGGTTGEPGEVTEDGGTTTGEVADGELLLLLLLLFPNVSFHLDAFFTIGGAAITGDAGAA